MITIPITLRMLIAKYLCLLKPFWLRKNNKTSVLLIIIILAMILGVVKIQVWLNDWNNDFFNALSQKETDKLWQLVLWFPALLGIDLQQKDNLAAANPQVVKEMQGVVREFIDSSQPPLSEVNQEKFNNIKKALSEAK